MAQLTTTYISTRGEAKDATYSDIVLRGLATDGGLYLPRVYPQVTAAELDYWRGLSYDELAAKILRRFATDIGREYIEEICRKTYTPEVYCNVREGEDASQIAPVMWLGGENLALLQLSNGPTLAFKDMAMQYLGRLFEFLLSQQCKQLNILGATSGDTGSAAEYAMRGREGIRVFMLSPAGRMSAFQRAQMYTLDDPNIFNLAIEGTFDDAQDIVKEVGADAGFKQAHSIGTVNSINWARISAQVVYYFKAWLAVTEYPTEVVDFTVPSGNFGNILAGWIAKQMGLPVGRLVVATNENDVLDEFFKTGRYAPRTAADTFVTSSPSMDISKASNFERYIFDIVGRNPRRVVELWTQLSLTGEFQLEAGEMERVRESGFISGTSTHADRLSTIRQLWKDYGILVDPHTADGVKVAREHSREGVKMITLETAQPAKFAETIQEAVGLIPQVPDSYAGIEARAQHEVTMPADTQAVKRFIVKSLEA